MRESSSSRPASTRPGTIPPASSPSALELLRSLLNDIPRMISERVQLLALELKRARKALVVIAALVVTAALLLLTAWFVLWGGLVAALIQAGLAWGWAVLIVLVINIGAAVGALLYASSLGRFLALPATMRHLTLARHDPGRAQRAPFTSSPGPAGFAGSSPATSGFAPGTGPAVHAAPVAPAPVSASTHAASPASASSIAPSASALSSTAPSSNAPKGPTP